MSLNTTETELFNQLINKIDKIKERFIDMRDYVEINNETLQKEYIEKLSNFSILLNDLNALSKDVKNEFLIQSNPTILNESDLNKQKNLIINKKIQDTFLPYMLYLQILLQNNPNDNN
jgi:hypothetical protein